MARFTKIVGLSDVVRYPKLGNIRLGIWVESEGREYPKEVEHFVLNPTKRVTMGDNQYTEENPHIKKMIEIYGENPREIYPVFLPSSDQNMCFPQALKAYGYSGLKCEGNGKCAFRLNSETGEWEERECPCPWLSAGPKDKDKCSKVGILYVIIPEVSISGVFAITTSSYNAIVDVQSAIKLASNSCQIMGKDPTEIPFRLFRRMVETRYRDPKDKKMKKSIHFPLNIEGNVLADAFSKYALKSGGQVMIEAGEEIPEELYPAEIVEKVNGAKREDDCTEVRKISKVFSEQFGVDEDMVVSYIERIHGIKDGDPVPPKIKAEIRRNANQYIRDKEQDKFAALIDPNKNDVITNYLEQLKYSPAKTNAVFRKFNYDPILIMDFLSEEIKKDVDKK